MYRIVYLACIVFGTALQVTGGGENTKNTGKEQRHVSALMS